MTGWMLGGEALQCRANHRGMSVSLHFPVYNPFLKYIGKSDGTVEYME